MQPKINEPILEERLGALEAARPWSPRVVSRLEGLIRSGEDEALFRVNPIKFAAERGVAPAEAIDLMLHAVAAGLFDMNWMLLCPSCPCVVESFGDLNTLHNHYHCYMCRADREAKLDDAIAVTFTVSPQVRQLRFHRPDQLSARDYCFKYRLQGDARLPDGPVWVEMVAAATPAVEYIEPGATARIEVTAENGYILTWSPELESVVLQAIDPSLARHDRTVRLRYGQNSPIPPTERIAPGRITLEIENPTDRRGLIAVSVVPPEFNFEHGPLDYGQFLSGSRLLTTQTFRNLFRSQVIEATEGIGIRDIALLFTDLRGSTALYDRIGDLNAYSQVQRHFERLMDVTVRHNGAVIKTIGDAVMAAFLTPLDAVAAALEMRGEIERLNEGRPARDFVLKIGVHSGPSIAVTLNERLDYFGQTVNIAARVQGLAEGDEICLSGDVYDAEGVRALLVPYRVERGLAQLKGVHQELPIYRVAPPSSEQRAA